MNIKMTMRYRHTAIITTEKNLILPSGNRKWFQNGLELNVLED